ncbi:hypothetical protein [Parapedobacter indicus]|uniref:RiboL-PSP-HEPN domain-containing protein n=1 Tax=Parapedobacter indicus TaxID=1477437 RepID=A0A1I3VMC4_9SPHI|nr:hypothetical protein [Parapedobacter indicus]PPK98237.1 hypothetical protein CLV26_1185 [Parapedobacter indicus]SFJ96554.1 hypothetical protein SAMN05444682_11826 [Parapedobacter indicus]
MSKKRVKIAAVYNDLVRELNGLKKLDTLNQTNFQESKISKKQLHVLTEFIFFNAFIAYENFIRDTFLLYTLEKKNSRNDIVTSYLKPKDFFHAEKLIQSSMTVIDWNSPDTIIERAELYLKDGFPIKAYYISTKSKLTSYRLLRNHIAHKSSKSLDGYKKVLRQYYGIIPLQTPTIGEYLLLTSKTDRTKYHLLEIFEFFEILSSSIK